MPLKVAVVGPGRSKQGTGPYISKLFKQLGCDIQAIVSSSLESAEKAASQMHTEHSINSKAYSSLDELLNHHTIDIVVISSPASSHLQYLQTAIEGNCHIFCEKPLWWAEKEIATPTDIENITSTAINLVRSCNAKQILLQLNTQWPYTLPNYFELYPQCIDKSKIDTFEMWLSPQSSGRAMIVDTVSHVLSMLYTLCSAGKINDIESNYQPTKDNQNLLIKFNYLHAFGDTRVSITLTSSDQFPKPAAYAINGLRVDRHVRLPNYLISLESTEKQIPIVDPLESSIKNFISSIYSKTTSDEVALIDGITQLAEIYLAVTQQ